MFFKTLASIALVFCLAVLATTGWSDVNFAITSPAKPGHTAEQQFTVTWTDSDSGDAIIRWFYAEDVKGKNRQRMVTLFHDDFEDGATKRWQPRVNSHWRIVGDLKNPKNLVVHCETSNEYLGTTRRDFGDVVVSARMFGANGGIAVRYSPEGEPPSYRLRGNLRLWKRPGNTGIATTNYPAESDWRTYEVGARNLSDGSVSLDGWVFSAGGKLLARATGIDSGQNGEPKNIKPAGIALHDDYFDDVYVDPVSARFVKDKENRFAWNTSRVPDGQYYLLAEVWDGAKVTTAVSRHPIQVNHATPAKRVAAKDRRYGWGVTANAEEPRIPGQPTRSEQMALKELSKRIKSFVIWESNRTGQWELYRINTDGSGFRKLTDLAKDNRLPYDSYLRSRISPNGKTVLFGYGRKRAPAEVWIVSSQGGKARKLTVGNPLNWSADGKTILFVRDNQVWCYELGSGKESLLYKTRVPVSGREGSMVGDIRTDLKAAVFRAKQNEYFVFGKNKTIKKTGGCEPGISANGQYLYWVEGPKNFRLWDIANNKESQLLGQPPTEHWNYTYFPTVSRDGRWLAYGASPSQHDHSTSDYEVFLQELKDWQPTGKPVRLSWDERTDRWPDVFTSYNGKPPAQPPRMEVATQEKPAPKTKSDFNVLVLTGNGSRTVQGKSTAESLVLKRFSKVGKWKIAYQETKDRNLPGLQNAQILWIGVDEIGKDGYHMSKKTEDKIKNFVRRGGVVIVGSQDSDPPGKPCGSGWIPEPIKGVEEAARRDFKPAKNAGQIFAQPNSVKSGTVRLDDTWSGWNGKYRVLATTNAGKNIALAMLPYGKGMYLVTAVHNETQAYAKDNAPLMENIMNFSVKWLKEHKDS